MKACLISDLHLFSSEIGGDWPQDSFAVFQNELLPKVKEAMPDLTLFLGDILDPGSVRATPSWPTGDEANAKFVEVLKTTGMDNIYALKGNHDYAEALRNISEMGGLSFIEDEWLKTEDTAFYFFSSRYPNRQKAEEDLKAIPKVEAEIKVLLMHECISIEEEEGEEGKNISSEVMEELSTRFDLIVNGHEHTDRKLYGNVRCLSSVTPWRPKHGSCNLEVVWKEKEPEIKTRQTIHGFYILDTESQHLDLEFVPVDPKINIAIANLFFSNASASKIRKRLEKLYNQLVAQVDPPSTVVRVYLKGELKEGDERIDIGLSDIEKEYYSRFYEGRSKRILRAKELKGGGAFFPEITHPTVEGTLRQLEPEIPKVRDFYEEFSDIVKPKTFVPERLLEQIKHSEVLEQAAKGEIADEL